MGVGSDNPRGAGSQYGLSFAVSQVHEKHFFPEPPDFMAAVIFCSTQDAEILPETVEDLGRRTPDLLDAVIKRRDAIHKIKCGHTALAVNNFDVANLNEFLAFCPVGTLFLHYAVWISTLF